MRKIIHVRICTFSSQSALGVSASFAGKYLQELKSMLEHLVRIQESLSGTEQRERSNSAWNKNILKHATL